MFNFYLCIMNIENLKEVILWQTEKMKNDGFTNDRIEEINISTVNSAKREYKLTEQQFNELKNYGKEQIRKSK